MLVVLVLGVLVAYFTFDYRNLVSSARIAYAVVIQLAVPLFSGLFWRRGTATGAISGLVGGFIASVVLTALAGSQPPEEHARLAGLYDLTDQPGGISEVSSIGSPDRTSNTTTL